ncbi:MAG: preQ(1) synthase [Candidatus Saganbacteria bacterium]|nr:preQ(1) synthase [Candidatus Saganbacteria bacterium]
MKNTRSYQNAQTTMKGIKLPKIDTFPNLYADRDYNIHIENPEFTCLCPKTGLPDFATVTIDYLPGETILELKSLKYYFMAYREQGVYHEFVANKILDDLFKACQPKKIEIVVHFNTRGGIDTTVKAAYPQ